MEERHAALLDILCLANRIARACDQLNAARLDPGISGTNARILAYLAERGDRETFQRDLEEAFSIRRSTVSKVVSLMEQKGLLERRPVARDARLKKLVLTDRARKICHEAMAGLDDLDLMLMRELTDDEVRTLRGLIDKIGRTLACDDTANT